MCCSGDDRRYLNTAETEFLSALEILAKDRIPTHRLSTQSSVDI